MFTKAYIVVDLASEPCFILHRANKGLGNFGADILCVQHNNCLKTCL